uniref:Glycosyltransferase n=1 Tax=Leonurus japonicus TaxID=4138 RepID=A0A0C5BSY6_LEOJA|nr:UDP-glucosyltransferase [Leonurus japonicus]
MERRHVLLVTIPALGHINPALQFAKRLINMGIHVTFVTSVYARRRMAAAAHVNNGLTFTSFSDGYDDGFKPGTDDAKKYMVEIRSQGSKALRDTIAAAAEQGRPITRLVYTLLLPWAAEVAREVHLPSALLWIQPATVLAVYYHCFHGYGDEISSCSDDPSWKIQIPGITTLAKRDLPSFMLPNTSEIYNFTLPLFKEQVDTLDAETKPKVLVNTFDALECDALRAIAAYDLISVGPLIPSAFLDGQDPSDTSFGGDLFKKADDYLEWLNSKPQSSVIYVSFGSLLRLAKPQMEEIGKGLVEANRPFLWVIRASEVEEKEEETLSCLKELERIGKIIPWCSQLEVLTHPSLGCFVTHCGWNSTLESLSCGVPVVAFPGWTDQGTNAKLIEDVWRSGVRVRVNGEGVVEGGELRRCIEEVMGDIQLRDNAVKWKALAREAVGENGSSYKNLKAFFN